VKQDFKAMNTQTSQLQLNVGFIAQQSIGYNRSFQFEVPQLVLSPENQFETVYGEIRFSRTSEGLLAQGKFQAQTESVCGRCLEAFVKTLETDFAELFSFPGHTQEDTELILPDGGQIDFGPIVGEYLALEIPITLVCRVDCKGLCVECGNNLNETPCDHKIRDVDPRMAVLKSLLDKDDSHKNL